MVLHGIESLWWASFRTHLKQTNLPSHPYSLTIPDSPSTHLQHPWLATLNLPCSFLECSNHTSPKHIYKSPAQDHQFSRESYLLKDTLYGQLHLRHPETIILYTHTHCESQSHTVTHAFPPNMGRVRRSLCSFPRIGCKPLSGTTHLSAALASCGRAQDAREHVLRNSLQNPVATPPLSKLRHQNRVTTGQWIDRCFSETVGPFDARLHESWHLAELGTEGVPAHGVPKEQLRPAACFLLEQMTDMSSSWRTPWKMGPDNSGWPRVMAEQILYVWICLGCQLKPRFGWVAALGLTAISQTEDHVHNSHLLVEIIRRMAVVWPLLGPLSTVGHPQVFVHPSSVSFSTGETGHAPAPCFARTRRSRRWSRHCPAPSRSRTGRTGPNRKEAKRTVRGPPIVTPKMDRREKTTPGIRLLC